MFARECCQQLQFQHFAGRDIVSLFSRKTRLLVQLTSLPHAKRPDERSTRRLLRRYSLPPHERLSYLPEETIFSPRNVVNETVKARETPANWNTRFFPTRTMSREFVGESGTAFSIDPHSRALSLRISPPFSGCRLCSLWSTSARRRIHYRINRRHFSFSTCSSFRLIL